VADQGIGAADSATSATTIVLTTSATVTVGQLIVVGLGNFSAATPTSVADSAGNTYTLDNPRTSTQDSGQKAAIFSAPCTTQLTSGGTITGTYSAASVDRMIVAAALDAVDLSAGRVDAVVDADNGAVTAWASTTVATNNAADVLVGLGVAGNNNPTSTPGGGATELQERASGGVGDSLVLQFQRVTATGTYGSAGTWSVAPALSMGLLVAYKSLALADSRATARPLMMSLSKFRKPGRPILGFSPLRPQLGGAVFNQDVTATATVTSASLQRQTNKPLSATATASASLARQVLKNLSATVTTSATLTAVKVILKALTATVTTSASLQRQTNKNVTATATVTSANLQRQANKRVSATVTTSATLTRQTFKNLTATVATSATLAALKVVIKNLTANVSLSATLGRQTNKPLSATATTSATLQRVTLKNLSATVTTSAALASIKVILKALTATVSTSASLSRVTNKPLSAATATSGALVRQVNKKLTAATTTTSATLARLKVVTLLLTATVATSAALRRQTNKLAVATPSVTATRAVVVGKKLTATSSLAATLAAVPSVVGAAVAVYTRRTLSSAARALSRLTLSPSETDDGSLPGDDDADVSGSRTDSTEGRGTTHL